MTSDEVSPPFCYPGPEDCVDGSGIYTPEPANAARGDFNGDGLEDLAIAWNYQIHTTPRKQTPAHVRFYLNDGNNNLISSPDIYALGEVPLRHMLYRMTVNDFNSDGRDDLFVGSMGVIMRVKGQKRNLNDFEPTLLLLSTQNGQMEDASHLIEGQENGGMIKDYAFSHATTSGDINCDGFIDIYSGNALLIGDGTGRFTHQSKDLPQGMYSHQKANSFASTIADFNGDGCGDVAMHLQEKTINVWMSNYGKHLPRTFKELKMENYYGKGNTKVNHMASGDLDGDGDPDLVGAITRIDPYYKGRKIVIFINEEGELIEKTKSLIQDDRDQLEWAGEGMIYLVDHDRDGDLDIIDSTDGSYVQNGPIGIRIFENDGTGHFTKIPQSEFVILREDMFHGYQYNLPQLGWGYPIDIDGVGRLDYVSFMRSPSSLRIDNIYFYGTEFGYTVLGRDKPIKHTQEELKKIEREFRKLESEDSKRLQALNKIRQANHPFSKALSSLDETRFEGESVFNAFSSPIHLYTPGAAIMGYKDLKLYNNAVMARLHLQFMGNNISTNVCIQYYPEQELMAARLSFLNNDWGGIKDITKFGTSKCEGLVGYIGQWEIGSNSAAMAELGIGIDDIIKDVQTDAMIILEALDKDGDIELFILDNKNDHSERFSNVLSELSEVRFEGEDSFTPFDSPIPLDTSGALLMGFNDLVYSQTGNGNPLVETRVHLKYGGHDISTNMGIQYYPEHEFTAARLSFAPNDWGGSEKITKFGSIGGLNADSSRNYFLGDFEVGNNSAAMSELGIYAVLQDVQLKVKTILEALDEDGDIELFISGKKNTYSERFSNVLSELSEVRFEGEDSFTPFDSPIPLDTSGALLMGFNDLVYSQTGNGNPLVETRVHLKYGGHDISTNMGIQYYPEHEFTAARLSFAPNDWGGSEKITKFGSIGGLNADSSRNYFLGDFEVGNNSAAMSELGIYEVLKDVQLKVKTILEALDKQKASYYAQEQEELEKAAIIEQPLLDELAEFEAELEAELAEENKSSPLFDGRYSFDIFRYSDDEGDRKVGSGFVEIRNGEVIIDKDNSDLKTGSNELYGTFSGQVNKNGKVSASMTLDVLNGIDAPEFYEFDGSIKDKKIWGETAFKNSFKAYMLIAEENKSSPLFDGRYSFNLFRYHDDEDWQELGNGFVEIINGEVMIDKDNSDLKTGPTDLYDTFSGQIDEKGNVSGSVELVYLSGKNRTEVFTLNGQIDKKIWGDSPREDFFRVYFLLAKE